MNNIEVTILSIIIMIGVGYFLKRIDFLSSKDIDPLNKIVMYILMPCMIFNALYCADLSLFSKLGILPLVMLGSSMVTGAVSYIILKQLKLDDIRLWSVLVTVMIANTAFMGYPVTLGIYGQEGFLRAIFCDIATLCTFLILSFVLVLKFGGTFKTAVFPGRCISYCIKYRTGWPSVQNNNSWGCNAIRNDVIAPFNNL